MNSVVSVGYLIICILYMTSKQVTGCGYVATHPQEQFCSRDFVLMGVVLTEKLSTVNITSTSSYPGRTYQIRIIYRMKGGLPRPGSIITVVTPRSSAACGITLGKGQQYVLSGFKRKEGYTVRQWDLHMRLSELSGEQSLYFFSAGQYSYRRNCQCKKEDGVNGCVHGDSSCLKKKAICRKTGGKCSWQNEDCS